MIRIAKTLGVAFNANIKRSAFPSKNFARYSSITKWNKDWQPGPYPRTEAERIAAAKKYNLIPEDYEPYPEEEGFGDYPKFPATHMEMLDDHKVYDFPVHKRNYGEPIHPDFDICLEDKVNFQRKFKTPIWKQFLYLTTGVTLYCSIIMYDEMYPANKYMVPKQYPLRGEKSYLFEAAD